MATKTIDHMNMYVAIAEYQHENAPDQTFNCLRVYVSYRKGKGFIAGYHPGWGSERWWGCLLDIGDQNPLTGGLEVLVKEATKNNAKLLQSMYDGLKQAQEHIAYLFNERDWQHLKHVMTMAAQGYNMDMFMRDLKHETMVKRQLENGRKASEPKFRPATMADIEGRDTDLYMNGERVYVLMVCRSETIESGESKLDYIMLTNMKKVQVEDLQVIDNDNNEPKSETTMATNLKAADLIGKTIVNKEGTMKYQVKGVAADGETLQVEFIVGDKKPVAMPLPKVQWEKLLAGGWTVGEAAAPAAVEEVEEVTDVKVEPAKTIDIKQKPKPKKSEGRGKKSEPKAETPKGGRYTFKTYTREKNGHTKTLGRIDGFQEGDEWLERDVAEKLHASPMYDRDDKGGKTWWLSFGKRYVDAGRKVCEALNAGKTIAEMQAIVDAQTDENHRMAEERKAKREAKADEPKGYSDKDVAEMLKKIMAGGDIPEDIKAAMAA